MRPLADRLTGTHRLKSDLSETGTYRLAALYGGIMAHLDNEHGKKGSRQWPADSLEGMPPRRRRFIVWWLVFSILLYPVVAFPLQLLGLPRFVAVLLAFLVFFVVAVPVIRAARSERRELLQTEHNERSDNEAPRPPAPDA